MNNRYLYRAKHVHAFDVNKKYDGWVYGYLSCENYIYSPIFGAEKLIDPNTICQCTGLKDKNGKLIWENDIVRDDNGNLYKAFWRDRYYQFSWICVKSDKLPIGAKWDFWSIRSYEIDVIGSAIDNTELLEAGE